MPLSLTELGWKPCFQSQLTLDEITRHPVARVTAIHRGHIALQNDQTELQLEPGCNRSDEILAVGDWVVLDPRGETIQRLVPRQSLLRRKAAGTRVADQLIAANVDTLLIVSSVLEDFNLSRLERYLSLAQDAGVTPLAVLTKRDQIGDCGPYLEAVRHLKAGLMVECVDARDPATLTGIEAWCGPGQTLALVGSSGVGKSTLANSLCNSAQLTSEVRASDQKGRHTTTARSLLRLKAGGLLIDTPGMRELQLHGDEEALGSVFSDIDQLASLCRFSDCRHEQEPGCAVQSAISQGELDARRLQNYQKLQRENRRNQETLAEQHQRFKAQGKLYKRIQNAKRDARDN